MILRFWISVFFWCSVSSDRRKTGINDCVLVKNEYVRRTVTKSVPYEERKFRFCWSIPPRCSYRVTKYETQKVIEKHPVSKKSWACCSGYKIQRKFEPPSPDDELSFPTCVPQCQGRCYPYGKCIAPFECLCNNGKRKNQCTKKEDFIIKSTTVTKSPSKSTTTRAIIRTEKMSINVSSSDSPSVTSEVSQIFSISISEGDSTNLQSANSVMTSEPQSPAVETNEDHSETTESIKQISDIDFKEASENRTNSVMIDSTNQVSDTNFGETSENRTNTTDNIKESNIDISETSKNDSITAENAKESSDINFSEASENHSSTTESTAQSFDLEVEETSENLSNVIRSTQQSTDIDIEEASENSSSRTENTKQHSGVDFDETTENHYNTTETNKQNSDIDSEYTRENLFVMKENVSRPTDVNLYETSEHHSSTTENPNQSSEIDSEIASTKGNSKEFSNINPKETNEYHSSTEENTKESSNMDLKKIRTYQSSTTEYLNESSHEDFKKMDEYSSSSSAPNIFWFFRNIEENNSFSSDFNFDILRDVVPVFSEEDVEEEENATASSTHQPLIRDKEDTENIEGWILCTIVGFTLFVILILFGVAWFLRKRLRRWVVFSSPKNSFFRKDSGRVIAVSSSGNKEESKATSTLTLEPCDFEDHPKIHFPSKFPEDKYYFNEDVTVKSKLQAIG